MIRNLIRLLILILLVVFSIFIWEKVKKFSLFNSDRVETTHNMVLEKITSMGKLELVKYQYRDVVEQEIVRDFLPDPKAILIVQGEAVGCIDLTKITKDNIVSIQDTIIITLPEPEVCNYRIDHSRSKIYKTDYAFMNEGLLLDEAYKKAESQILKSALESDILDQTKKNAETILKPLLENISKQKVVLKFELKTNLNKLK